MAHTSGVAMSDAAIGDYPFEYVSTFCRTGSHSDCHARRVVRCGCPCHEVAPHEDPQSE